MTDSSPRLRRCFPQPSLVAYKRSKNLGDLLVRAKIPAQTRTPRRAQGFRPCGGLCPMCPFCRPASSHECATMGKTWKIVGPITCKTKNVVYKLSCKKCSHFLYIGETSRRVCDRFAQHKGYITQKKLDQPTGRHFNAPGHEFSDLVITPIERVLPLGDPFVRKIREKMWITRYDSVSKGQNTQY